MYAEAVSVLVFLETQVQPQIIFYPDYLPDDLSVSYDYDWNRGLQTYRNNTESQSTIMIAFWPGIHKFSLPTDVRGLLKI